MASSGLRTSCRPAQHQVQVQVSYRLLKGGYSNTLWAFLVNFCLIFDIFTHVSVLLLINSPLRDPNAFYVDCIFVLFCQTRWIKCSIYVFVHVLLFIVHFFYLLKSKHCVTKTDVMGNLEKQYWWKYPCLTSNVKICRFAVEKIWSCKNMSCTCT